MATHSSIVEVAALVGHVHGHAVAVHGVDDAARGDLGLQQADAVTEGVAGAAGSGRNGRWRPT